MKLDEPVSTIMAKDPITVSTQDKLSGVWHLIRDEGVHHVPVAEGGKFIGLISSTDLFRMSFGNTYAQDERTVEALLDTYTIRDAMQEDVLTVQRGDTIRSVAEHLATGSFHGMPVLDGDRLVGMVTSTDLIRLLIEQG